MKSMFKGDTKTAAVTLPTSWLAGFVFVNDPLMSSLVARDIQRVSVVYLLLTHMLAV